MGKMLALILMLLVLANSMGKIEIYNRAEQAIGQLLTNRIEWNRKMCHPFPPDSYQYLWLEEYNSHLRCVHEATPRTRKTTTAGIFFLEKMFKYPWVEVLLVTPRMEQGKRYGYRNVYEWIAQNELLKAYVKRSATGKMMLYDDRVELYNGSKFQVFGIDSRFEGVNATDIWVDETDDILPSDKFKKIFDRGLAKNKNGLPTFSLLTGMIKSRGNLYNFHHDPLWHVVQPRVDLYLAIELGILAKEYAQAIRGNYSQEEWLRLMLLEYVESRNFIWESKMRASQAVGLHWQIQPEKPIYGRTFRRTPGSFIAIGLDGGAQGSGDDASDYALVVTQATGPYRRYLYSKIWSPTTDSSILINEWMKIWEYFRPDGGYADALIAGLISQFNGELYKHGLVDYDWTMFGDNSQRSWTEWREYRLLTPLRNSGIAKHNMYMSLKTAIDNITNMDKTGWSGNVFIFPQEDTSLLAEEWQDLSMMIRELGNLNAARTNAGYLSIGRIKKKIDDEQLGIHGGILRLKDDRPDALAMSNFFLDFLLADEGQKDFKVTVETQQRVA